MAESKRLKIVLASLENQGCVVEKRSRGWFIKFPDGVTAMTVHATESDHRSELNIRARIKRAGLAWPFDK